ncbi:hypothetical protein [Polymorphospora rubra]|uniref:Uncharacterized protein n=1 Tax=Polymorphospora rubra TaxID=338584 RepID=A0A810N955_9ACTN|nr:hypothetical protein [Polymorphospora rubra]BCJ68659.1 hypothetical protein Prubr_56800 [Polymorphospora rubra]
MHHIGPYRLLGVLATCPVGTVWAASDSTGRRVTLAVLDAAVAGDPQWRAAFAATANALSQADDLPVVGANHVAATPWVACAAEAGQGAGNIFIAMGQRLVAAPPPDPGSADQPTVSLAGQLPPRPVGPDTGPEPPTVALGGSHASTAPPTGPVDARPAQLPGVADPVSAAPAPVSAAPAAGTPVAVWPPATPVSGGPMFSGPVSGGPVSGAPMSGGPVSGGPVSGGPVSGGPTPPAAEPPTVPVVGSFPAQAGPMGPFPPRPADLPPRQPGPAAHPGPSSAPPATSVPHLSPGQPQPSAVVPAYPPLRPLAPARPRRKRGALVTALVAVLALVLGAAGGAAGMWAWGGNVASPGPDASPSPSVDIALPDTAPRAPGLEPPTSGGWPSRYPDFGREDRTQRVTDLPGVGISFRMPETWRCESVKSASGFVHYSCGTPPGQEPEVGGDLIVRHCPGPCDEQRRIELRKSEEAFGLQWIRSGLFTTWAETDEIGAAQYGLVYMTFWRSVPEGPLDRQLVLRMTAPAEQADELRKLTNSIRDVTFIS